MAFSLKIPPALRERKFALFWAGLLISMTGSMMQSAALLWHLRTLSDQPVVVSGIGLVRFLPVLLLGPIGGLVADSFNRRKILFVTQSVMTFSALALGTLTWLGVIQIWHIYLLTALQMSASAFDMPARGSLVPNLVPRSVLTNAFSMQSIAFNTGAVLGPALSGVVIAYLGQHMVYWINAASFLAVIGALILMGSIPHDQRSRTGSLSDSLAAIGEGVRFILAKRIILSSMLLDFTATFFSSASTLLPFVARDVLGVGELGYGWLSAASAIGAVSVGLVFSQRADIHRQGRVLMGSVLVFGLATAAFGLSTSYGLVMVTLIVVGGADAVSTILRNTIRQLQTPDAIRGRMVSINQIFFNGGPQLGEIEAGLAAQAFGVPFAIISGGVGCILMVFLVARIWPELGRYRSEHAPLTPTG